MSESDSWSEYENTGLWPLRRTYCNQTSGLALSSYRAHLTHRFRVNCQFSLRSLAPNMIQMRGGLKILKELSGGHLSGVYAITEDCTCLHPYRASAGPSQRFWSVPLHLILLHVYLKVVSKGLSDAWSRNRSPRTNAGLRWAPGLHLPG